MTLIADALILLAAATAALYCLVLARRLNRLNRLDSGLGAAIAALSAQVGDLTLALDRTRGGAREAADTLAERTGRAEDAIRRMELLMAALNDLPDPAGRPAPAARPAARRRPAAGPAGGTAPGA
jgi:ABC-type transporter Mla subunit MlaD